jgi:hypothetical protein
METNDMIGRGFVAKRSPVLSLLNGAMLGAALCSLAACSSEGASGSPGGSTPEGSLEDALPERPSVAVLGGGQHSVDAVTVTVLGTRNDGLNVPRDLAFRPEGNQELWVVNQIGPSMALFANAGTPEQTITIKSGSGATHFMARPSALAFGKPGFLATVHEEDEQTQGPNGTPKEFMGPTLWLSDPFQFDGGHASHMDMLHNSPNSMGIAWQEENIYWIFDGAHQSITRYDFREDHGPGGAAHDDGIVARYLDGEMGYEPEVPSHMEFDHATAELFIADSANSRIVVLDTESGTRGSRIFRNYDGSEQYYMDDAEAVTFAEGGELSMPSGLALRGELVFVTDNATSKILAYDREGTLIDWLDTELPAGSLMGMTFDDQGQLYIIDAVDDRVLRITARESASVDE